jgi:hypothetical protein
MMQLQLSVVITAGRVQITSNQLAREDATKGEREMVAALEALFHGATMHITNEMGVPLETTHITPTTQEELPL